MDPVRLACVKHAVSVRPEPGSNSPNKNIQKTPQKRAIPTKKTKKTKHNQNSCAKPTHKKSKNKNTLSRTKTTTPHQEPGFYQYPQGFLPRRPITSATEINSKTFASRMSTSVRVTCLSAMLFSCFRRSVSPGDRKIYNQTTTLRYKSAASEPAHTSR